MADPVKVSLLKAITAALEGVSGVGSVRRSKSTPPDRETDKFPAVYVYDLDESIRNRNQVERVTMPLTVVVWVEEEKEDAADIVDTLAAEIYKAMLTDSDIRAWCLDIKPDPEGSAAKFSANDNLGGITLNYIVEYAFTTGDPYDPGRP